MEEKTKSRNEEIDNRNESSEMNYEKLGMPSARSAANLKTRTIQFNGSERPRERERDDYVKEE